MSDSVLDLVTQALGSGGAAQIGKQLGLDGATANKAIGGAIPVLMGALARNSASSGGAGSTSGSWSRLPQT